MSNPMQPEHFRNDLLETVERVRERMAALHKECKENGASWTPEQEARWEGAFLFVRALLVEELEPLRDAWEEDHPLWRSTEEMLKIDSD